MHWFIYAAAAALLTAGTSLIEKEALRKEHATEFSAVLAVIVAVMNVPLFLFVDYSTVTLEPLILLFLVTILAAFAFLYVSKGVRHMEISSAGPLLALSPLVTAVLAFFFLNEHLTMVQWLSIGLVLFGVYVLETKRGVGLLEPLRIIRKSKYIHYIFYAVFLYGITALFDRFILTRYPIQPIAYLAFAQLFLGFHFIVIHTVMHDGITGIVRGIRKYGKIMSILAVLTIGYRYAQLTAIDLAFVALVLPIKRTSSLITTFIGGELFHEHNIGRKLIAAVIIIIGVVLIAL